jgi:hypothetical protein
MKDGKLVIPNDLQHRAISWYHHYLQHPGSTRLEETIRASMYWKGICGLQYVHMSKSVKLVKSTSAVNGSMVNFPQNRP